MGCCEAGAAWAWLALMAFATSSTFGCPVPVAVWPPLAPCWESGFASASGDLPSLALEELALWLGEEDDELPPPLELEPPEPEPEEPSPPPEDGVRVGGGAGAGAPAGAPVPIGAGAGGPEPVPPAGTWARGVLVRGEVSPRIALTGPEPPVVAVPAGVLLMAPPSAVPSPRAAATVSGPFRPVWS